MQDLNQQPTEYTALLPAPVPTPNGQPAAVEAPVITPTTQNEKVETSATKNTYAGYILDANESEAERLARQFKLIKGEITDGLLTVLDGIDAGGRQVVGAEQTLTTHLRRQIAAGRRPVILDAGCAEGLHLHYIADLLAERVLLSDCYLLGVDKEQKRVAVADDYALAIGKPHLQFGQHDLTRPLQECELLDIYSRTTGQPIQLDFIYVNQVLLHLPDAHRHLKELYAHLAPGGYLMLIDPVTYEGGQWGYDIEGKMTPLLEHFYRVLFEPAREANTQDVGENSHNWLSQWGAEIVEFSPLRLTAGGDTAQGRGFLRNFAEIIANSKKHFVEVTGRLSKDYYAALQKELFERLSPEMICEFTLFRTVARKPA